jgi:hypothetical protein
VLVVSKSRAGPLEVKSLGHKKRHTIFIFGASILKTWPRRRSLPKSTHFTRSRRFIHANGSVVGFKAGGYEDVNE